MDRPISFFGGPFDGMRTYVFKMDTVEVRDHYRLYRYKLIDFDGHKEYVYEGERCLSTSQSHWTV